MSVKNRINTFVLFTGILILALSLWLWLVINEFDLSFWILFGWTVLANVWVLYLKKPITSYHGSFIVNTTDPNDEVYRLVLDEELPYLTNRKVLYIKVIHK